MALKLKKPSSRVAKKWGCFHWLLTSLKCSDWLVLFLAHLISQNCFIPNISLISAVQS